MPMLRTAVAVCALCVAAAAADRAHEVHVISSGEGRREPDEEEQADDLDEAAIEAARVQRMKGYMKEQIEAKLGDGADRHDRVKEYVKGVIKKKVAAVEDDARKQEVKDYMRDQIRSKLGHQADDDAATDAPDGDDDRKQEVKDYMRDQIQSKLDAQADARKQQVKDYIKDQIQGKLGAQGEDDDRKQEVKDYMRDQIQSKLDAQADARKQQVKDYIKDQIQSKLGDQGEDADAGADGGDPEDLQGGDMSVLDELDRDLAAMNKLHDHDDMMRKELEGLDLMDENVVEELGKYSENLAKCMFRCIHLAHRFFSAEGAAREACECTKTSSTEVCDECQYLADDKVKDEEGNAIEAESIRAEGHLSETHFQGSSSRGRCVVPGEVAEARKINFRGAVVQC